jgi:hypothetical protein
MEQLTIPEVIDIADLSIPISANYQADGALFGKRKATTAPNTIALVADALRWQYEAFPNTPEVNAIGSVRVDYTVDEGTFVEVFVNDPILGTISLGGVYLPTQDDVDANAFAIAEALSTNHYGYSIPSVYSNPVSIVAPPGRGSDINGNNNLFIQTNVPAPGVFTITQFSGGVNGYTNTSARGVANYLQWLCGKFGLEAEYIISEVSGGGAVVPINPVPLPNPIDFTVLISGSFMVDGQSTVVIPTFIGYNVIFVRGGIVQPTIDLGSSYYNWVKSTGTFACFPAAVEGEIFQIIPVTQTTTI